MPTPADMPTLPAPLADTAPPGAASGEMHWRRMARALGWPMHAPAPPAAAMLGAARRACIECLADLPPINVRALCALLANASSLSELWHLRPEVFRVLALHHSQAEAERRLALASPLFERRRAGARQGPPR